MHKISVTVCSFCILCSMILLSIGSTAMASSQTYNVVGVYELADSSLVSVAKGRISTSLRDVRAERLAREQAIRNAKRQIIDYLFEGEVKVNRTYSMRASDARIIHEEIAHGHVIVAITVNPRNVKLIASQPLEDFHDVQVSPIVEELFIQAPALIDGGGRAFDREKGWVGLGIGYAVTAEDKAQARKIAEMNAHEALASFIFGVQVNTVTKETELIAEENGSIFFTQWVQNSIQEEITGVLHSAQKAGEWLTDDGYMGVAVIVGQPSINLAPNKAEYAQERYAEELYRCTLPQHWEEKLRTLPWLLSGGASLCKYEGTIYLLAVESGALKNEPVHDDIQLPTIMASKAQARMLQFLSGFTLKTVVQSEETQKTQLSETELQETIHKVSRTGSAGLVRGMKPLGKWYSKDAKTLYNVFIVPI